MGTYHTYMIVGPPPVLIGEPSKEARPRIIAALNKATEHLYGDWAAQEPDEWDVRGTAVNMIGPIFITSLKGVSKDQMLDALRELNWYNLGYYEAPPVLLTRYDNSNGVEVLNL